MAFLIAKIDQHCAINRAKNCQNIGDLQELFQEHNALVRLFKTALEDMSPDDHKIIIQADKHSTGSENVEFHDIALKRRNDDQLQRVYEVTFLPLEVAITYLKLLGKTPGFDLYISQIFENSNYAKSIHRTKEPNLGFRQNHL